MGNSDFSMPIVIYSRRRIAFSADSFARPSSGRSLALSMA
jgi:hypothetical protein